jgi:threonine synthase
VGVIARYRDRLPVGEATPELTLGEGGTPLLAAPHLSERLGLEVHLKCEGLNPTGSFKDRGMAVAVAKAVEEGAEGVVCASTGNTAASAAAYAARAGLPAVVLHPTGAVAAAKLAQARAVGARVLGVRGSFDEALASCRALADRSSHALVNSLNSYRIEGQKTAAFEIVDALGRVPDVVAMPYGGGGNLCAYALGFGELASSVLDMSRSDPGMAVRDTAGSDPDSGRPVLVGGESSERATTLASAIRIAQPVHGDEVDALVAASRVRVVSLGDSELVDAWRELATLEGVFCEPSSAAGLAALKKLDVAAGSVVVCVLTGHGLKDAPAVDLLTETPVEVDADVESILAEVA